MDLVQMVPNHVKLHHLSRLWFEHKWFEEGMGYASPNFRAWYKAEIRFSDTIDDIIWLRRKKCDFQIRYHFYNNSCGPVNGVKDRLVLPEGYS